MTNAGFGHQIRGIRDATRDAMVNRQSEELVNIAMQVERSLPGDPGLARKLLADLDHALSASGSTDIHTSRLRRVIARLSHDIESGHVRAIAGLSRETRRYCAALDDGVSPTERGACPA